MRWFLRRRVNRVLNEISTRLDIEIKPFQLTKRRVLIDRLAYDPKVMEAMQAYAQEEDMPREVAQAKAVHYAREIVPSFNAYLYFRFGYWLAKKVARLRPMIDYRRMIVITSRDQAAEVRRQVPKSAPVRSSLLPGAPGKALPSAALEDALMCRKLSTGTCRARSRSTAW